MKNFKFILTLFSLLICGASFAQVTIRDLAGGQGIFTAGQKTRLLAIRSQLNGLDSHVADYKANPTQYDFDHWHSEVGVEMRNATGGNVFQYAPVKNNGGYRDHFYDVAVAAWLDDDLTEAALVVDYLIRHFNDDDLDVSNGQAINFTNPTHGTFERFYVQDEVNPWFEFNAWVNKCMRAWILINDIPGFSTSTANRNLINEYFAYAADWAYRTYLFRTGYRGINLVNYTFSSNGFNSFFNPNSKRTNPFLEDASGNPYNEYQVSQVMSLQNTAWDWIDVIDTYGIHYNVDLYKDWIKNAWDYYFTANIFPNGINMELYRGYDDKPNWGMFYTPVTLASLARIAHGHAVAVENGVPGMSDKWYFFERTVTEGIEDIMPNYCCAGTGDGTPKGLLLALQAHARFLAQGAPGNNSTEWSPNFYNNQQIIDGDNGNTWNLQFTNPFALANCYYNDGILERAYKRQGEFAHIPTTGGQVMGAYSNDEGTLYKWGSDPEFWREMEPFMYSEGATNQRASLEPVQGSPAGSANKSLTLSVGDSFTLGDCNFDDPEDGTGTVATAPVITRQSDDAVVGSVTTGSAETFVVLWSYTDGGGLVSTATLTITVEDTGPAPTLLSDLYFNTNSPVVYFATPGEVINIAYTKVPANPTTPYLWVLSSNDQVIAVDDNGNLVGVGNGTTQITIRSLDGTNLEDTITAVVGSSGPVIQLDKKFIKIQQ